MHYIYFNLGLLRVIVTQTPNEEFGELLGTSTVWGHARNTTKKLIVMSLINNSSHKGITGIKIVDGDAPTEGTETT